MGYDDSTAKNDKRLKRNRKNKFKPKGSLSEEFNYMRVNKGKKRLPQKIKDVTLGDNE